MSCEGLCAKPANLDPNWARLSILENFLYTNISAVFAYAGETFEGLRIFSFYLCVLVLSKFYVINISVYQILAKTVKRLLKNIS